MTRTRSSREKPSDSRRGLMTAITERWLPFLTALLVLATAVLGLYAQRTTTERNKLESSSTALEAQVRQLSDDNRRISATNGELTAENANLRQQLEGTTSPSTETTAPTTTEPARIFRRTGSTPVVVRAGFEIDLDTDAANWGVNAGGGDVHVSSANDYIYGRTLAIVKAPPTPQDCEAQTVLLTSLTRGQTVIGQKLCLRTSDDRWAYVQIARIDNSAKTMSFRIIVWKLPTDP